MNHLIIHQMLSVLMILFSFLQRETRIRGRHIDNSKVEKLTDTHSDQKNRRNAVQSWSCRTVVPAVCLHQLNVTEDGQERRSVMCRSATGSRVPDREDTCIIVSRHNLNVTRGGKLNQWSVSCMAADTGARPGRRSTSRYHSIRHRWLPINVP